MRRLLLVLFFVLASAHAHAAFPASTGGEYYTSNPPLMTSGVGGVTLCNQWRAAIGYNYWVNPGGATGNCAGVKNGNVQSTYIGYRSVLVCPSNSTLNTSSCTCDAGYVEQSNACVPEPPPNCPAGTSGGGYYFTVPPGGTMPQYAQQEGSRCVTQYVNDVCTLGPDGTRYCHAQTKLTGDYCPSTGCTGNGSAPGSPSPTPPEDVKSETSGPCQPGYYYGTVNGQTVCVPGQGSSSSDTKTLTQTNPDGSSTEKKTTTVTSTGTSPNGTNITQTTQTTLEQQWSAARQITFQSESSVPSGAIAPTTAGETKTSTVTNADGSKTEYTLTKQADGSITGTAKDQNTVQKTESTTCTGSACTVNSTTTTNGQQTGSTTGTTTKDGLCQASPDNPQCGDDEGSFGGTCDAGYTCEGDAVQCAQALAIREFQCSAKKMPEGVETEAADLLQGRVPDGFHMDGPALAAPTAVTGSCGLTDFQVAWIFESTLSVEMSRFCQFMDAIRAVIGIMGALAFATIVFRGN